MNSQLNQKLPSRSLNFGVREDGVIIPVLRRHRRPSLVHASPDAADVQEKTGFLRALRFFSLH
jgi:hypothetical protein